MLWSLRTTHSQATGYTPFFMVYDSEAILPTDLNYGAPRIRAYDEQGAEASHQDAMDQLDEARDITLLRSAKYQQALRRYHSRCVWGRPKQQGPPQALPAMGGLYIITEVLRPGAYKLKTIDGEVFTNA